MILNTTEPHEQIDNCVYTLTYNLTYTTEAGKCLKVYK